MPKPIPEIAQPLTEAELLERFGLMTEQALAAIRGVTVHTIRCTPHDELPEFVKWGRRRLFKESSFREKLGLPERQ